MEGPTVNISLSRYCGGRPRVYFSTGLNLVGVVLGAIQMVPYYIYSPLERRRAVRGQWRIAGHRITHVQKRWRCSIH
ncbi:hypothetical protein GQ600_25990 [Phytophthora cactorum]|nr:hypothetical protein GQ600_25990 [Phytophthora cactorum]